MTLKPTRAYIPVSVEERLPEGTRSVMALNTAGGCGMIKPQLLEGQSYITHWLDRRENVYALTEKEYEAMWEELEHRVRMRTTAGSDISHTFWKGLRYDVEKKLGK